MSDDLKPVRCGCGGEVDSHLGKYAKWFIACDKCGVRTPLCDSRTEAITVWNRAMGTEYRTLLKVLIHDAEEHTPKAKTKG